MRILCLYFCSSVSVYLSVCLSHLFDGGGVEKKKEEEEDKKKKNKKIFYLRG